MRKVREILRLGLTCRKTNREIGSSCMVSHVTVGYYLAQAQKAGLSYSEIEKLSDKDLKAIISSDKASKSRDTRPQPDWSLVHQELKKKGVTLQLLWEEYKQTNPDGYQSSQFYEHYKRWSKKLNVSLRQTHKVGEKLFVDYAGQTMPIIDRRSGKTKEAQIFVAVLGASNYTYAEATLTQGLADWINSHVKTFSYFGGVSQIVVPDNLKSGVTKPCWYEPDINLTYHDLPVHYGTVIIPTRVRKPKDKSKVEAGVLLA